jgi:hypothetical protein
VFHLLIRFTPAKSVDKPWHNLGYVRGVAFVREKGVAVGSDLTACDHVMSVVEQYHKPDDPDADGDGSDQDPEQASAETSEAEIRGRRVRLLRLASRG